MAVVALKIVPLESGYELVGAFGVAFTVVDLTPT